MCVDGLYEILIVVDKLGVVGLMNILFFVGLLVFLFGEFII